MTKTTFNIVFFEADFFQNKMKTLQQTRIHLAFRQGTSSRYLESVPDFVVAFVSLTGAKGLLNTGIKPPAGEIKEFQRLQPLDEEKFSFLVQPYLITPSDRAKYQTLDANLKGYLTRSDLNKLTRLETDCLFNNTADGPALSYRQFITAMKSITRERV